ncbi:hypothetical protein GOP47_0003099 [Adiantum capillus-veneris]|uniref:Uncharacterized protein n=1 Tax=Adiantum capillus-veneris TaxID=13818 RepID=A0A9D4VBC1_ADICA|nr:hypothetical protein GOP47_0003099 [Adiantum capillus-veneris]
MAEEEEEGLMRIEYSGPVDWIVVVRDIISYILFMHHQIPLPLDQLELNATENIKTFSQGDAFSLPSEKRVGLWKARVVKRVMKRREKLRQSIQALLTALQGAFQTLSFMPSVLLLLGSSTKQPRAAYDIQFLGRSNPMHSLCQYKDSPGLGKGISPENFTISLSKRITRTLISEDKGPLLTGPLKLFLLIKADATSCIQDFFPKRCYTTQSRKTQAHLRGIQLVDTSVWCNGGSAASIIDANTLYGSDMICL